LATRAETSHRFLPKDDTVEFQTENSATHVKEKFHLFLLAGQSNMAGRGVVEDEDRLPHPRVLSFNQDGRWVPAVDPIHFDKPVAGVCLARTFGIVVAEKSHEVTVGLIPCAAGGSPISAWTPGGYWEQTDSHPYDDAIRRAKEAMTYGVLKAILWHQGESDAQPDLADVHEKRLHDFIHRFRHELNAPDLPFIIGQLGQFEGRPWDEFRRKVNAAHEATPPKVKNTAFVPSDGLTPKEDGVHFNSASLREFGRRYAHAYFRLAEAFDGP